MKKIVFAFAILALSTIAFISCQREAEINNGNDTELAELHFHVKGILDSKTRTHIVGDGAGNYTPYWNNNDELGAFLGTGSIQSKAVVDMTLTNTAADEATADFEGTAVAAGDGTFQAFYPASAFEKGYAGDEMNVGLNIGDKSNSYKQYPAVSSPDPACDILLSKSCDYLSDGTDVVIDDLYFGRPLSVLKINLKGSYAADEEVSWLKMEVSSGTLTGRINLNMSTGAINTWTVANKYAWAEYTSSKPVINHATDNTVFLVVNPTTIATGATVTFTASTDSYDIEKAITLTKDLVFPLGGIAVINLTIAESNCTPKAVFVPKVYDKVTSAEDLVIAETIIMHRDIEDTPAYYYIPNAKGSKPASKAIAGKAGVTLAGDLSTITISSADVTDMTWAFDGGDANFSITSTADATLGMGSTGSNDGLSIQTTYKGNPWTIDTNVDHGWDIMHDATSRYLAVNTTTNVRTYTNNATNQNAPFYIYQLRDGKTSSGIVWSSSSALASITSGDISFSAPTLTNPHSLTVAYSSSNTDVATINPSTGAISIVGEGSTVIQASFAGDETYRAIKKRYELTVTDSRDACATPTFSPVAGAVAENTEVTISSTTTGSTIYYTTNGDTPTVGGATTTAGASGAATATVTIDAAKTIKAIAVKSPSHKDSDVATAAYTIAGASIVTTFTFSSSSWASGDGDWTSGKAGNGFTSGQGIQVTTGTTGANATSPSSFTGISKIVVTYNTNKSAGAGSIKVKIGSNSEVSNSVAYSSGDGRSSDYTTTFDYSPAQTGNVKITVNTTTNSIWVKSIAITHQ